MTGDGVATAGTGAPSRLASEPAIPEDTLASTAGLAVRVAGALTLVALIIAVMTRLYLAMQARRWLAYPFTGVPAKPGVAAEIFAHNLRALGTVGGALIVAQVLHATNRGPARAHRVMRLAVDLVLAVAVLANLVVVGVSFGAYCLRMVTATLPHGPVELASYSLALALYLQGRRRRVSAGHVLVVGGLSVAALTLAAVLETFVRV